MWVLLQVLPEGFKELAPDPQQAEAAARKEEEEAVNTRSKWCKGARAAPQRE